MKKKLEKLSFEAFSTKELLGMSLTFGGVSTTYSICRRETNTPSDPYACADDEVNCYDDDGVRYHTRMEDKYCV